MIFKLLIVLLILIVTLKITLENFSEMKELTIEGVLNDDNGTLFIVNMSENSFVMKGTLRLDRKLISFDNIKNIKLIQPEHLFRIYEKGDKYLLQLDGSSYISHDIIGTKTIPVLNNKEKKEGDQFEIITNDNKKTYKLKNSHGFLAIIKKDGNFYLGYDEKKAANFSFYKNS